MALPPELAPIAADPASSAILLDFDGTLAEIVSRPQLTAPAPGAAEAVAELAGVLLAPDKLSAAGIGPSRKRFLDAVRRVSPALPQAA